MGYKSPRLYSISSSTSSLNPLDSTDYYFGESGQTPITSGGGRQIYIPVNGFIRSAYVFSKSPTATGTNENIVIVIRLNNTTDYTFSTVGAATQLRTFSNDNLNIPVTAGDYIEFKMTTPAWATNPEGFRAMCQLGIDTE